MCIWICSFLRYGYHWIPCMCRPHFTFSVWARVAGGRSKQPRPRRGSPGPVLKASQAPQIGVNLRRRESACLSDPHALARPPHTHAHEREHEEARLVVRRTTNGEGKRRRQTGTTNDDDKRRRQTTTTNGGVTGALAFGYLADR